MPEARELGRLNGSCIRAKEEHYANHYPEDRPFLVVRQPGCRGGEFYISIFNNSKIAYTTRYEEQGAAASGRPEGTVMTVAFELDGQEFVALNGGPVFKFTEAISFVVNCESQDEVDHYLGKAVRRRRREGTTMRVAERQVRCLMADSSHAAYGAVE